MMKSINRATKLALNTSLSLCLQFTTIICGFILPRLILISYGSSVNGLVNSISQFLGIVSLLDLGVGAVVQSTLYTPLADKDYDSISKIYKSASRFFRKIAFILLIYVTALLFIYPHFVKENFSGVFTITLIVAICISSFAQYYFGVVNSLLLAADQKGYITYFTQIITLIINTAVCAILIKTGCSIQVVKLTTSLIFLMRPIVYNAYVNHNYKIDKKVILDTEPIKQKWNGMAQHFASYLILGTDNIILTLFSSLSNVSIYSVYYLVIGGVNNIFYSITNGFQSLMGDMLAKKETDKLYSFFSSMEWMFHTSITLIFGCTSVLVLPFVQVYTAKVNDANYYQPIFAVVISIAYAAHCMRLPYHVLIKAAGHYRETQMSYIVSTILNIVISITTVKIFGLIGVSLGTLIAMLYQTIWMAWYDSKHIINWPFKNFLKQLAIDILTILIGSLATFKIPLLSISYYSWVVQAIEVFCVWCIIVLIINLLFYRDKLIMVFDKVVKRIKRGR